MLCNVMSSSRLFSNLISVFRYILYSISLLRSGLTIYHGKSVCHIAEQQTNSQKRYFSYLYHDWMPVSPNSSHIYIYISYKKNVGEYRVRSVFSIYKHWSRSQAQLFPIGHRKEIGATHQSC